MIGFIGIDAGGTKTDFRLADENGNILSSWSDVGCRLLADSREALKAILDRGIESLLQRGKMTLDQIGCACMGISGYGESPNGDQMATDVYASILGEERSVCTNDCRIAWAGALGMKPGVNVIAGTESIAYGENGMGGAARSGGWGSIFDEGSCRWIGERLIQIYTRQADGRIPHTALYEAFRRHEEVRDDEAFLVSLTHGYLEDARHMASLQRVCLELWRERDPHAVKIYERAAEELALTAAAVAEKLNMEAPWKASYAGGLFHAGEAILLPFQKQLEKRGGILVPPQASPAEGAVVIAAKRYREMRVQ